jgi:hypothetical protein
VTVTVTVTDLESRQNLVSRPTCHRLKEAAFISVLIKKMGIHQTCYIKRFFQTLVAYNKTHNTGKSTHVTRYKDHVQSWAIMRLNLKSLTSQISQPSGELQTLLGIKSGNALSDIEIKKYSKIPSEESCPHLLQHDACCISNDSDSGNCVRRYQRFH